MQKNVNFGNKENLKSIIANRHKSFIKDVFGMTNPYAAETENLISEKQIQILEDAIKRYERLEDIKKFTNIALQELETVTEDDIKRALELEKTVSIDNDKAVLALIQNEGFLKDLTVGDFSDILASNAADTKNRDFFADDTLNQMPDDYFDDFEI